MQPFPFLPRGANQNPPVAQINIAVTAAVQQLTLTNAPQVTETTIRVSVDGTQNVAWSFGVAAGLTTGNGVFMLANTVETFTLPIGVTQLSCIAAATGSNLRVSVGDGL
jgi:hypothetical protein